MCKSASNSQQPTLASRHGLRERWHIMPSPNSVNIEDTMSPFLKISGSALPCSAPLKDPNPLNTRNTELGNLLQISKISAYGERKGHQHPHPTYLLRQPSRSRTNDIAVCPSWRRTRVRYGSTKVRIPVGRINNLLGQEGKTYPVRGLLSV